MRCEPMVFLRAGLDYICSSMVVTQLKQVEDPSHRQCVPLEAPAHALEEKYEPLNDAAEDRLLLSARVGRFTLQVVLVLLSLASGFFLGAVIVPFAWHASWWTLPLHSLSLPSLSPPPPQPPVVPPAMSPLSFELVLPGSVDDFDEAAFRSRLKALLGHSVGDAGISVEISAASVILHVAIHPLSGSSAVARSALRAALANSDAASSMLGLDVMHVSSSFVNTPPLASRPPLPLRILINGTRDGVVLRHGVPTTLAFGTGSGLGLLPRDMEARLAPAASACRGSALVSPLAGVLRRDAAGELVGTFILSAADSPYVLCVRERIGLAFAMRSSVHVLVAYNSPLLPPPSPRPSPPPSPDPL
eukprot:CAMPEP_0119376060 /NCGR_PEP_ID=MMETSP1334-20130426/38564_1 /TAXON_ID=127549 /ORGANISM="Calcidiscus leptoporus, Strain RCC1130" /LENGTH=359 /DNA_ID=CAMNT_0007394529 /DNA_START=49 /DNA_END=1124 /DNA_ORIENTATION=-